MKLLLSILASATRATGADECAPANEKICENMSKVPDKADAVCGSDGITYSNQCLFKHYKCITGVVVNKRHNGPCVGEERLTDNDQFNGPLVKHHCPVKCHKSHGSKVCGTDGVTYRNECEIMQKQCDGVNVFFEHFGECCEDGDCSGYEGEGVVRSGMMHDVQSVLMGAPETFSERPPEVKVYAEFLREKNECLRGCTNENLPVCGSDGVNYPNECVLREQKCKKNKPNLTVLSHGYCSTVIHNHMYDDFVEDNPDFAIARSNKPDYADYRPEDYSQPEALREAFAMNTFYYQPEMVVNGISPVFEFSDGDVGVNERFMLNDDVDTFNLVEVDEVLEESEVVDDEEEEEEVDIPPECIGAYPKVVDGKFVKCPEDDGDYEPVCGSNGQTYFSRCVFLSDKCFGNMDLEITSEGMCEDDPLAEFSIDPIDLMQRSQPIQQSVSDKKKQLQKERLEKRRAWRIENRKKPKQEERQATVDEYKRTLQVGLSSQEHLELFGNDTQEEAKKTPAERQAIRLANRVQVRQERRHHQRMKQQAKIAETTGLMLFDAVVVDQEEAEEPEENAEAEIEAETEVQKKKFPDMCSKISCDDFAEATETEICGRVKNMATQTITGEILSFRSRCFFKRKRCHYRKKGQQLFNQRTRRTRAQEGKDESSELQVLKFNRVGERLKRCNCQTGEPL